eukprot:Opistho-1_new@20447
MAAAAVALARRARVSSAMGRPYTAFLGGLRSYATKTDIDASKLQIEKTKNPKPKVPFGDLVFGRTFSDHMLEIEYDEKSGWSAPKISPYHKLQLDPACTVFHYAVECFEGMKAYQDAQGNTRLFRPDKNMDRISASAERLALPSFDRKQFLECIKALVRLDKSWIPNQKGFSLYIRPTLIGTQESLGVGPSSRALLYVICSPVGPYYKSGFAPVKLLADSTNVRAWPGGTGANKVGGNYAPTIKAQQAAAAKGYQQILWLFGPEHELTEVGTMNLFVHWKNEAGEVELATPPLDGSILPGVTRDSVLSLARQWGEFKVSERKMTMKDVVKAVKEGRMIEMFGAGTACIVSPIEMIHYQGQDLPIPLALGKAGKLTQRFNDTILGIQYGEIPSEWSVVI